MYLFELNKIPPDRLVPQSFLHVPLVPLVADWPQPRQMDAVLGFAAGWDAMVCYDSDDEELTAGPRFRPGKSAVRRVKAESHGNRTLRARGVGQAAGEVDEKLRCSSAD
ncbi:hypothetical protein HaLaN_27493, partial [Haematococcus lacustris]